MPENVVTALTYWVTLPMPKAPPSAFKHTNTYTTPERTADREAASALLSPTVVWDAFATGEPTPKIFTVRT